MANRNGGMLRLIASRHDDDDDDDADDEELSPNRTQVYSVQFLVPET